MIEISKFFIKNDIRQEQRGIPDLAIEIKAQTLLQPIIVQKVEDEYEILDGRRRFYAMRDYLHYSHLEEVKHFIIREGLHALAVQFSANEHRQDFLPLEKAMLVREIHEAGVKEHGVAQKGKKGVGWSLEDTGKVIARDKGYVSRMLSVSDHGERFKDCKTDQECFVALQKDREKKVLEKVQKAKIKKAEKHLDLTDLFKTIVCTSAQEFLPTVATDSIDLIHTDPPFAIDYESLIQTAQYDAKYEDDPDTIMAIVLALIPEFYRVLRDNRYMIMWCGYEQSFKFIEKLKATGFSVLPTPIVWMKLSTAGKTNQPNVRLGSATQFAILAWKGTPELAIKGRHNYFPYPIVRNNRIHQAQMPEELIMDLISIFSSKGDLVLDCFSGSLSTMRCAHVLERRFTGCELQQKNIENGISYSIDWITKKEIE